ncbi:putative peptidase S54 [Monocercomonoides exilis]|uniref:putative peptidase S54 n=1 Tax=Monocercomonoides exilis TaxID=2049356 RepID=UPI0035598F86|nr:putative peptidase S54 [Monocercomonoides exilis]|eukprot:MONOS_11022.1-p1 / transcript=MONOS_11022.1 / gene=MONOS_11022 / organism=Monocercomonoides_exilis_PA203 / gene_product=peptidase S54 / transcript_product=peptidase S54 / location=Mono_scaffold00529:11046-12810(-) / protein_length=352 / sequence_SO=supercontig / SO=protein_coding / is_pseudo=false
MANIHSFDSVPSDEDSLTNPWKADEDEADSTEILEIGHSISGKKAKNPWGENLKKTKQKNSFSELNDDNDTEQRVVIFGNLHDEVWSDNLPPGTKPNYCNMVLKNCGCLCFVGPCCSTVRKKDYCKVLKMFTPWISLVQIVMFIISLCLHGFAPKTIGPTSEALIELGAKYPPLIKCSYHFHRVILPCLLHSDITHILMNGFFQYQVMFYGEARWKFGKTALVYFVSTFVASWFSCAIYYTSIGIGASGALMGIFGYAVVETVDKWKTMDKMQRVICIVFFCSYIVSMVVLSLIIPAIDHAAHLGGFISGFCLGLIFILKKSIWKIVGLILLAVSIIVPILVFYLATGPKCG